MADSYAMEWVTGRVSCGEAAASSKAWALLINAWLSAELAVCDCRITASVFWGCAFNSSSWNKSGLLQRLSTKLVRETEVLAPDTLRFSGDQSRNKQNMFLDVLSKLLNGVLMRDAKLELPARIIDRIPTAILLQRTVVLLDLIVEVFYARLALLRLASNSKNPQQ
jgi:hypothetical protein